MYIRDNEAQVARQDSIHISDFPPQAAVALQHFIEHRAIWNLGWADVYFALLIEPETPQVFPMGKCVTIDYLEQLLRRYAVTMKDHGRWRALA